MIKNTGQDWDYRLSDRLMSLMSETMERRKLYRRTFRCNEQLKWFKIEDHKYDINKKHYEINTYSWGKD